jgi:ribosomal protein S12 methylthiotransferase accessory factor
MTADDVVDQRSHLRFWTDHRQLERAAFLWGGEEDRSLADLESLATGDPRDDLQAISDRLYAAGHRVFVAELTTEDVATLGLSVVRAVVPGLHPLCAGHTYRALGGRRLRRALAESTLPQTGETPNDNPAPHPYP